MLHLLFNSLSLCVHDKTCSCYLSIISRRVSHQSLLIRGSATFRVQFAPLYLTTRQQHNFPYAPLWLFFPWLHVGADIYAARKGISISRSVHESSTAMAHFCKDQLSSWENHLFTPDLLFLINYDANRTVWYHIVCCDELCPIFVVLLILHAFYYAVCVDSYC